MTDTTHDAFLGGRLSIVQPARGYRAGVDAVLLASAVAASAGQTVLDLGCGVGVASLCLASRVPGVAVTGVELQPAYANLAQTNATANALPLEVITADLRALPAGLRQRNFDHVMANPPYFDRRAGTASTDPGRNTALGGDTALADWIDCAARRLTPRGRLTLILRIERLPDVLPLLAERLGSIFVHPIAARADRRPHLFLLQARKDGRAPFRLAAPLIMHAGVQHQRDGKDYTDLFDSILRHAAALSFAG